MTDNTGPNGEPVYRPTDNTRKCETCRSYKTFDEQQRMYNSRHTGWCTWKAPQSIMMSVFPNRSAPTRHDWVCDVWSAS